MRDLSIAHKYVPGIIKTEITTEMKEGVGASRKVYQSETKAISETVTEWHEGRGFVIRLHQGEDGAPAPFSQAIFKYWLDSVSTNDGVPTNSAPTNSLSTHSSQAETERGRANQCRVTVTLSYTPRWGLPGRLLNKLLLQKGIHANLQRLVRSMKDYYQGKP